MDFVARRSQPRLQDGDGITWPHFIPKVNRHRIECDESWRGVEPTKRATASSSIHGERILAAMACWPPYFTYYLILFVSIESMQRISSWQMLHIALEDVPGSVPLKTEELINISLITEMDALVANGPWQTFVSWLCVSV